MIKVWSESDIQFLKENYPSKGAIWCAKRLGVKKSQVNCKAEKLKIRSDRYNNTQNEEKFVKLVRAKSGTPLWNEWLGTHKKHLIRCQICNHEWNCYPCNVIKKNKTNWCPNCAKRASAQKRRKYSESDYVNIALVHGGVWLGPEVPLNMKQKTSWSCKLGHKPFYSSYRNILSLKHLPCPECRVPWLGQTIAKLYLERFTGLPFPSTRPSFLKYETGAKLELDGFNEELKVAFEYNGMGHYVRDSRQKERDFLKLQKRDVWKKQKTEEIGIKLLILSEGRSGVNPDSIRERVLDFLIRSKISLVDNYKNIVINPAEIYLIDPRKKLCEQAKKLNLVPKTDTYIDRNSHILFGCLICGHERDITPYSISWALGHNKDNFCPKCSGMVPVSIKDVAMTCAALNLSLISGTISSAHDFMDVRCNKCENPNRVKAGALNHFVKRGKTAYCPVCSKKKKRTIESMNADISKYGFRIISKEVRNVDTPIEISYPDGSIRLRSFSYIKRHISKNLGKK